jgi:hypothetical protein
MYGLDKINIIQEVYGLDKITYLTYLGYELLKH